MPDFVLKEGAVLPNGAEVLYFAVSPFTGTVVLCKWGDNEFVTWKLGKAGDAYWGHYFKDLAMAVDDFLGRIGK